MINYFQLNLISVPVIDLNIKTSRVTTCEGMWLEGCETRQQVEDSHLDERIFSGPVLQHPTAHLIKQHVNK